MKRGRPKKVVDYDTVIYDNQDRQRPLDWSQYDIYLEKKNKEAILEGFVEISRLAGFEPTWKDRQDIKKFIVSQNLHKQ